MTVSHCSVCGVAHATCGTPSSATPIGIPTEVRTATVALETRWVNYNGTWRLFNLNADDPRFDASEPYVEGEQAPGEMDPAYEQTKAAAESAAAEKKSRTAANKSRTAGDAGNK